MLKRAKSWHQGLSTAGKVILWSITAVLGGTVIASANSSPSPKPPTPHTTQTTPKEEKPYTEKKTITDTSEVAFTKITVEDGNLDKGHSTIRTIGVNGIKTFTYEVTYEDGKEKDKKLVKEEITTIPITEVTAVGTKVAYVPPPPVTTSNCHPNYTPCIPNGGDLDCPDIGHSVTVHGADPYRLDADNDGTGCDSY